MSGTPKAPGRQRIWEGFPRPGPGAVGVLHGTSYGFYAEIKEKGMVPPPGHSQGVRVRRSWRDSIADAKAWSAFAMLTQSEPPHGIIVYAIVPEGELTEVRGVLRTRALHPRGLRFREIDFPDLYNPDVAAVALERWEKLTAGRLNRPRVPGSLSRRDRGA